MLFDFLGRLGFTGLSVSLNSVGTEEERPGFIQALRAWFSSKENLLDEDDRRRLARKPAPDPRFEESAPRGVARRSLACRACSITFLRNLPTITRRSCGSWTRAACPYRLDPRLVRGLDYYTRTVFEVTAEGLGAQNALLGGGRYDKLVSDLGGPKTAGIGFAIGEDRLVDALPEAFREAAVARRARVALVPLDECGPRATRWRSRESSGAPASPSIS